MVEPFTVNTFLSASCESFVMPLDFLTITFWPVMKVDSEKSICASRSLLWVREAVSRSTRPCCSSGMRAATASWRSTGLTPMLLATALQRSTS